MSEIVMIRTDHLNPHPDNPRKDVGDVTELAESIKANGILQNLTVVPYYSKVHYRVIDGLYTVIIGHRRLAAAKLAGIEELPCVIANMTEEEQLSTMLTENMQRTDLTVYEQAKSFQQLSMDFGMSVAEISKKSGFSEATVRKRTKLAELDEKKFKKACERGATLYDFAELEKIEDPADKEAALDVIGTPNFKNVLKTKLDAQNTKRKISAYITQLSWAKQIDKVDYAGGYPGTALGGENVKMVYVQNYGYWSKAEKIEKPADADTVEYYWKLGRDGAEIDLYKKYVANSAEDKEEAKRKAIREADEKAWAQMTAIQRRHKELRKEFVKNYSAAKANMATIVKEMVRAIAVDAQRQGYYGGPDAEDLFEIIGAKYEHVARAENTPEFKDHQAKNPEWLALVMTWWILDNCGGYAEHKWNSDIQRYQIIWRDNQELDNLYYFLEALGYERSDEERQLSRATHRLFSKTEVE